MADGSLIFDTGLDNSGFKKGLTAVTTAAVTAAAVITTAFTGAAAAAVKVGSSFTASMSQVAATMGITRMSEDYELLANAAKEMGAATKFSATEAGNALNYLALAGYDAQKSVAALPTVLNVAAAGGIDLAYASDMITDSMSALGLGMNELEGFSDKLAKASQKSNTSVAQLGEAILTVGGTAKSLSGGVTELNTMLGLIADNGIKGAEGGTALRNIILSLSAPTNTAAAAMERLNFSAFDSAGNMRDLAEVFSDLNTSLAPLTEQQKTQALNEIFNKVDLKAVNALLGTSSERFAELAAYIEDSEGAAAQMAETMNDNLSGDVVILQSALEGLGLAAFDKFETPMRTAVQSVTEDISVLTAELKDGELAEGFDKISESAGNMVTVIGKFAANDLLPAIIKGMTLIIDHGGTILSMAAGIGTAIVGFKLVPKITAAVNVIQIAKINVALLTMEIGKAGVTATALGGGLTFAETAAALFSGQITIATAKQAAFNAVCSVNPFTWVAVAIGVVITAIGMYISHVNKAKSETKALTEETNEYAEAMDKVVQDGQENIDKTNDEVAVIKEKASRYEELRQRYENLTKGEMAEFKALAEELQGILPEGTEIINEQTGAYNSLADSIDRVCKNMEAQAVLNAKYKQYEEAAAQNYDLDRQIAEVEKQYEQAQGMADLYAAEGVDVNKVSSLDSIAMRIYGMSYDTLVSQRNSNQAIIDEYHQLYEDTYNELNAAENASMYSAADSHRLAGQAYADTIRSENEKMLKVWEENTAKLEDGFERYDHQYSMGIIKSEEELYRKKKSLLDKYGEDTYKDHWKFYEEISGYEKEFADNSKKLEEERRKNVSDTVSSISSLVSRGISKNTELTKEGLKNQLEAVKSGLSSVLSEYSRAMSDLQNNMSAYKNRLLSVGDVFSVDETEINGQKVKTLSIENTKKQMEEMKKYHSYIKKLRESGASQGLIGELTSFDFEDGAQIGKYLSGLSDAEFAKINDYYKERDALADELSKDLYADEAEKLNSALMDCVNKSLEQLPPAAQTAGREMLKSIIDGMSGTENLAEEMSSFIESFFGAYQSALEDVDLTGSFTFALGGIDTYSMGRDMAKQLMSGFNEELARSKAEITVTQHSAAADLTAGSTAQTAQTKAESKKGEKITIDNTNNITVQIDGETVSRTTEKRRTEKERRTG